MTLENASPWLREVKRTRPVIILSEDFETDVAVVGGGISGVATSYFLLRDTNLSVILLEKGMVAHGATGHNGGQAVAAFERTMIELSEKFGEDKVSEGLRAINSAWKLLYSIISETGVDVQIQEVTAHLGLSSLEDVLIMLRERKLSDRLGLPESDILLADDVAGDIPDECQLLVRRTPRKELDELLLTRDSRFICAHTMRTALMNSALFCEELVVWMLKNYPGRFRVYEDTPVQRIKLINGSFEDKGNRANLETGKNLVNAKYAVLCTNGYNDLEIEAMGVPINTAMKSLIGFMVGYRHKEERGAAASVYFSSRRSGEESYFYMTRRRHIDGPDRELTCVGGPDLPLGAKEKYFSEAVPDAKEHYSRIEEFYKETIIDSFTDAKSDLSWHGLMGYTSSGVRIIGRDQTYPSLIYNMGCNGIGLLPSIYGGKRVAQIINGEILAPSIFDPNPTGFSPKPEANDQSIRKRTKESSS